MKMVKPFEDEEMAGAAPLYCAYRKSFITKNFEKKFICRGENI